MVTIAMTSLCTCGGCTSAMLDIGEPLLEILPEITFTQAPLLVDCADPASTLPPRAVVGVVMGAVRRRGHMAELQSLRDRVDILVALGTCAVTGGLPSMSNLPGVNLEALTQPQCTVPGPEADPDDDLLPYCSAVRDHVRVDLQLPGCSPHPDWIEECILSFVDARTPLLPGGSVCSVCPARRSGTRPLDDTLFRMLDQPEEVRNNNLADMPCLLEQGFMCMGPVTHAGCGGREGVPYCINNMQPCRGCYGPAQEHPQPLADYVGALTAAGYDPRTMPDKPGFLSRFSGVRILSNYREKH